MKKSDKRFQKMVILTQLRAFIAMIENEDDPKLRCLMLDWITDWLKFQNDTQRLMEKRSDIWDAIKSVTQKGLRCDVGLNGGHPVCLNFNCSEKASMRTAAARWFLDVIRHPLCSRVGRCDRCGRIFVSKTARKNKRFCRQRCANAAWRLRPAAEKEENKKLAEVRSVLISWPPKSLRPGQDPKRWLHERTGVSMNWLTRRIASRDITLP